MDIEIYQNRELKAIQTLTKPAPYFTNQEIYDILDSVFSYILKILHFDRNDAIEIKMGNENRMLTCGNDRKYTVLRITMYVMVFLDEDGDSLLVPNGNPFEEKS